MRSNIHSLYPSIYRGIRETDILADIGDVQYNKWFSEMDDARRNQFVLTAGIRGIEAFEKIYEIKANPLTEDIEFRRQRLLNRMRMRIPFTFRFLLQRLDDLIGPGNYKAWLGNGNWHYRLGSWRLGEEPFRDDEYTLYVEATTTDIHWHQEVQIFIGRIKPANMVYVLSPMISHSFVVSETIGAYPQIWNYKLGGWALGHNPFLSDGDMEVVKLPETSSLTPLFLNEHAKLSASRIVAVRLNGSLVVDDLQKLVEDGTTTIRYTVSTLSGLKEITGIEILQEDGVILTSCSVFIPIPVADQLMVKHIIHHEEGFANG